jgi:hypothetical protein
VYLGRAPSEAAGYTLPVNEWAYAELDATTAWKREPYLDVLLGSLQGTHNLKMRELDAAKAWKRQYRTTTCVSKKLERF